MANAEIEFWVEETLGGVVVGVNDDGAEVEVVSLLGDIALGGDGEKWQDGTEDFIALEKLRRACPCAGCKGERDVMGNLYKNPDRPLAAMP